MTSDFCFGEADLPNERRHFQSHVQARRIGTFSLFELSLSNPKMTAYVLPN
jgi:hypothetical protein